MSFFYGAIVGFVVAAIPGFLWGAEVKTILKELYW